MSQDYPSELAQLRSEFCSKLCDLAWPANPSVGRTAEDWALIITIRVTTENPRTAKDAERIYTEIIKAAMNQERHRLEALS